MKCLKSNWTRRVLALAMMGTFLAVGAGVAAYSSIEARAAAADRVDNGDYEERLNEEWGSVSCFGEKEEILASSPAGLHGALRVENASLVDKNGEPFRLYGMSTHGIAWFPQYVNEDTFSTLRDDWKTNCVRLAMYTEEYGGYCSGGNKEELKALVKKGVDAAAKLGMYVIIDWHVLNDRDPNIHKEEAIAFFQEMSSLYRDRDNVLYEICNEPNGGTSWESIKSYAKEVIPVIRSNDKDAVIIVGTPDWSQEIDKAAESPLEYGNIMYALHFYAGTHTDWLRQRLERCEEKGLPVFVSEFGMCDASGNGGNNFEQAAKWMNVLKKYNISCCCWNLANKAETSSVIAPSCEKISGWTQEELSESGRWIRDYFISQVYME
ncbi:glycoside hydrolase family 5 protein [Lachnospiraceae bacterium 62-35]